MLNGERLDTKVKSRRFDDKAINNLLQIIFSIEGIRPNSKTTRVFNQFIESMTWNKREMFINLNRCTRVCQRVRNIAALNFQNMDNDPSITSTSLFMPSIVTFSNGELARLRWLRGRKDLKEVFTTGFERSRIGETEIVAEADCRLRRGRV